MFAPFGNQTANNLAVWHPEPRGRGTFNVLSSCLTTMILCVWTSVHLNIPGHNDGKKQSLLRKPGWLFLALLAPEIVAWNAWEQRRIARELTNDFIEALEPGLPARLGWIQRLRNAIRSKSASSEETFADPEQEFTSHGRSKITLVHGFYAAMGGYVIQTHLMDRQYPITTEGRLTLTKNGIQWLLKYAPEVFPSITEAEILDKSKASTLVKTLTCLQALWFCLQCIVRLTMKSSISLLELNVFGHCICTFIVYAIWWSKPMDIAEPTVMNVNNEPEHEGLVALLCSFTSRTVPKLPYPLDEVVQTGYRYTRRNNPSEFPPAPSHQALSIETDSDRWTRKYRCDMNTSFLTTLYPTVTLVRNKESCFLPQTGLGFDVDTDERELSECARLQVEQLEQLFDLDGSHPHIKVSMYDNSRQSTFRITIGTEHIGLTYHLSRKTLNRLGIETMRAGRGAESCPYTSYDRPDRPLIERIHDWTFRLNPTMQESSDLQLVFLNAYDVQPVWDNFRAMFATWGVFSKFSEWLAMAAAALVYGGLHLLAWSAPFRAPIYGLLWKISGITTASLVILPFLIVLFISCTAYASFLEYKPLSCLALILSIWALLSLLSFVLLYIFARVYLVVECFLSLAYLPESVLVTPNFSLYFPHIG